MPGSRRVLWAADEAGGMDLQRELDALRDEYGEGKLSTVDPDSVRGLLALCKAWPNNQVGAEELRQSCLRQADRMKAAAKASNGELKADPNMSRTLARPITHCYETYEALAEIMEELPDLARDDKLETFMEVLDDYEAERQMLLEAQADVARQRMATPCVCPGCVSMGKEPVCPECGLLRMYPDPAERPKDAGAPAARPYADAYKVYKSVMAGRRPLGDLLAVLSPLETHLHSTKRLCERQHPDLADPADQPALAMLRRVLPEVRRALKGIARIRAAQVTLRMSDVNHGWDDIYDSAVAIGGAVSGQEKVAGARTVG